MTPGALFREVLTITAPPELPVYEIPMSEPAYAGYSTIPGIAGPIFVFIVCVVLMLSDQQQKPGLRGPGPSNPPPPGPYAGSQGGRFQPPMHPNRGMLSHWLTDKWNNLESVAGLLPTPLAINDSWFPPSGPGRCLDGLIQVFFTKIHKHGESSSGIKEVAEFYKVQGRILCNCNKNTSAS